MPADPTQAAHQPAYAAPPQQQQQPFELDEEQFASLTEEQQAEYLAQYQAWETYYQQQGHAAQPQQQAPQQHYYADPSAQYAQAGAWAGQYAQQVGSMQAHLITQQVAQALQARAPCVL